MAKETNNKFEVMAESSANLLTDAEYAAEAERIAGVVQGIASSILNNTSIRMNSVMAVALANFIARKRTATDINTVLTPEQIDAYFEEAIQAASAGNPIGLVWDAPYSSVNDRFEISGLPTGYVFPDDGKLTIRCGAVTDEAELVNDAILFIDGTPYNMVVKDTGNTFKVSEIQGQKVDVVREGALIVINRVEPIENPEIEYDLPIQSQQVIVPVENSPFFSKDGRIVGESAIQLVVPTGFVGNINTTVVITNTEIEGTSIVDGTFQIIHNPAYPVTIGDKIYISFLVKSNTVKTGGIRDLENSSFTQVTWTNTPEYQLISFIATMVATTFDVDLFLSGALIGETMTIKDIMLIPLLSAKQLALSLSDLNNKYTEYFEDLKSVENQEVKCTNKNLLRIAKNSLTINDVTVEYIGDNKIKINGNPSIETRINVLDAFIYATTAQGILDLEKTMPTINDDYTMSSTFISGSQVGGSASRLTLLDEKGFTLSQTILNNSSNTVDLNGNKIGAVYLQLNTVDTFTDFIIELQLEIGTIKTNPIENENSSKKYSDQILRDLPNGVADYIDTINNVLHKKIDCITIQDSDVTNLSTGTNVDWVRITIDKLPGSKSFINGEFGQVILEGSSEASIFSFDNVDSIGLFFVAASAPDYVGYIVAQGTSLVVAQAELNGKILQFELAEEVITENIDFEGLLLAYKNMTIENIQDNGFGFSVFARHSLNYEASVGALAKALAETQKQLDIEEVNRIALIARDSFGGTIIYRDGIPFIVLGSDGNILMSGQERKIRNLKDPDDPQDAVTLGYADENYGPRDTLLYDAGTFFEVPQVTVEPGSANVTLLDDYTNYDEFYFIDESNGRSVNFILPNTAIQYIAFQGAIFDTDDRKLGCRARFITTTTMTLWYARLMTYAAVYANVPTNGVRIKYIYGVKK